MTTIATDGRTVAGDGLRRSSWGCKTDMDIEKIHIRHGRIYAFSGSYALLEPIIAWHAKGADPHSLPVCKTKSGWMLAVISGDGAKAAVTTYHDEAPYPEPHSFPFTMGSGCDYALGAMDHGATPQEAVRIACWRDESSGGEIQVVDIAQALGLAILERAPQNGGAERNGLIRDADDAMTAPSAAGGRPAA